jgi:signal transduction histidine kinase
LHSYHEFEGTGIGLSICKKIIEKHNGHIRAESTPDKGASFIITLPDNSGQNLEVKSTSRERLQV